MRSSGAAPPAPWPLKLAVGLGLAFLHFPIAVIAVYAFNSETSAFTFPIKGFTTQWFGRALARTDVLAAIGLSLEVAAIAVLLAVVLGTLAALAVHRQRFAGRDAINLLFNLPIALPGIITGIALLSTLRLLELEPGLLTIVIGHARGVPFTIVAPTGLWVPSSEGGLLVASSSPLRAARDFVGKTLLLAAGLSMSELLAVGLEERGFYGAPAGFARNSMRA